MRLLSRYVLIEVSKVFFVALASLTLLLLIVGVVREATDQGLGFGQVVLLLPYILPDALRFTVPATVLFAVSTVYGRMAGSNEIVAIKSLGISPMTVVWPTLILTFLLSLCTVWLNDLAVSWGRNGIRRVAIEAVEDIAYGMLRTQRSYSSERFSINVRRVEGNRLIRPTLTFHAHGKQQGMTLIAEDAELSSDPAEGLLKIICHNYTVEGGEDLRLRDPDVFEIEFPLLDASRVDRNEEVPSKLPMWVFREKIDKQKVRVEDQKRKMAALAGLQLMTGDFTSLAGEEWAVQNESLKAYNEQLHRLYTEPQRRWANGFSCLCFAMVGIPLAIRQRNADLLTSFFLCFLPILIIYYPFLAFSVDASKQGDLPPISIWSGNVVLAAAGMYLFRYVVRY